MTEQLTPDPEGTGAEEPSDDATTVMARLQTLEDRATAAEEETVQAKKESAKKDETISKLQSGRDRLQRRLDRRDRQVPSDQPKPGEETLREFANTQARETMILRELMDAGLTEGDLGVDFEDLTTPAEVRNAISIAKLEKHNVEQDQRIEEAEVDPEVLSAAVQAELAESPPSPAPIDIGGPTVLVPAEAASEAERLRAEAVELRKRGDNKSLQEARWKVLRATELDPQKILGRGRGGPTVEG